jgi:hypothetical protein
VKPSPDKVYGPKLADLFQKLCLEIAAETKAKGIRVKCEFLFRGGSGELKMQTFTTPDGQTERLLDPEVPMPRGSKLQQEVISKMRSIFRYLGGK